MAKSARASSRKTNNQRLKAKVFGPVESARAERLSARLLELAAQPKPPPPEATRGLGIVDDGTKMDEDTPAAVATAATAAAEGANDDTAMDIDGAKPTSTKRGSGKKRVEKRRKRSSIVFPKFGDKNKTKRRHSKK
ncbi:hypothetical protein GGS23DRAFT_8465 [Durotheca rogersii]|uniref:uncharacterized protein n=1 Tax=Durotheca rogersii TaxID=419775 RepID=UPI002220BA55|nr:uncharacterized protein GGS23DRAFT_8465 [Durotheca rogersii]KAI5868040.1 hypothetical protein GGS23DRAFT_8465 [Durotheca rogersii]